MSPDKGVDIPTELLRLLTEFRGALAGAGEEFWVRRLDAIRDGIAAGDPYAVRDLVTSYGGSGSLNDLQLDVDARQMSSRIYAIATKTWKQIR